MTTPSSKPYGQLHMVIALPQEAQPIVKRLSLKRERDCHAFPLYTDHTQNIFLIVSGKGALNCAAATNFLAGRHTTATHAAWLNIGIAGHHDESLGTMFFATKVINDTDDNSFYPTIRRQQNISGTTVLSLAKPTLEYPPDVCIDMEAASFCQSAKRFASAELIHSLKIVSDNKSQPWTNLDAKCLPALFEQNMPQVETIAKELLLLSSIEHEQFAPPHFFQELVQTWDFSETQKHQLRKLLTRRAALKVEGSPLKDLDTKSLNRNSFLEKLENHLDNIPLEL